MGSKIRQQRRKRSLTLKELSSRTGLSISFLSEIERGLAQPSMASLKKIRKALGISLLTFREGDRQAADEVEINQAATAFKYINDVKLVRAGQRKKLAYPGRSGFYELLTPDLNRQLEVLYFRMPPGFDTGPEPLVDPAGEKCMVILAGRMIFKVDDEAYHLDAGDSLSYPADAPVSWKSIGDVDVEGILIITPPCF